MTLPSTLHWFPILTIEEEGIEPCVCLEVDHPSRCYVTADGIVTHNSGTGAPGVASLPKNPRALLDGLLRGQTLEDAARSAGLPPDRAADIARNVGRFLANDWHARGLSEEDARRELQQHATELAPLGAAAKRTKSNDEPNVLARASYNHIDKWLTGRVSAAYSAVKESKPGQVAATVLAKLADAGDKYIPFFKLARELLSKQAVPLHFVPEEAKALLRERQIQAAFGKQQALDVHRSLGGKGKFTDIAYPPGFAENPAMKKRLFLAMTGEIPLDQQPQPLQDLAAKLRKLLVDAGTEAVAQGRMSADTLLNLQEHYLPHYYESDAQETGFLARARRLLKLGDINAQRSTAWHIEDTENADPNLPHLNRLVTWDPKGSKFRFKSEEHRNAFYEEHIREHALQHLGKDSNVTHLLAAVPKEQKSQVRAELARLTRESFDQREKLSDPARGAIRQAVHLQRQRFQKRAPLDVEQQEKAGLIFDPIYATVKYLAQMAHDNATAELFNKVAENPAWVSDTQAQGFKQIPDTRTYGRLAGKHVIGPLADQLTAVAGEEGPAMELYDDLMRAWSSGKTVWNPGTHVRNFLGNFLFSQLSGTSAHNPANWGYYRDGMRAIRDGGEKLKEMYEHGVLGGDFSSAELKAALKELLPDPSLMGEDEPPTRIMARVGRALFGKLPGLGQRALTKTSAFAHGVYKVTDDFFKAAAYLKARGMGMEPEAAAAHVREFFPYYDHIGSSGLIKFARRLHPFLSFGIESARILKNAAIHRPLSLASSMIVPYILTQISMNLLGLQGSDRDEVLKDMRGKLKFKGMTGDWPAFSILLPFRQEGRLAQFDLSNIQPFAGLLGRPPDAGDKDDFATVVAKQLLSSPLLSPVAATAFNQDPFSGRHIIEEDMTAGERAMQRAKFVWNILAPPLAPGGSGWNTVADSTQRSTNKTLEKRSTAQAVMRAVLGLDVRNASPDLYRLAEDYRKAHGLQQDQTWAGGSTEQQRHRQELFAQLAQDSPNIDRIAQLLRSLGESGKPVSSSQDINRLLFYKNPLMVLHGHDAQTKFHYGLQGESRQVLESALAEYRQIEHRAPGIIAQARAKMLEGGPVVKKTVLVLPK